MAKKEKDPTLEADYSQLYNPLLVALSENDKKNLFVSNVRTAFLKTGFHLFDFYFGSVINVHDDLGKIVSQEPRIGQAAGTFNLIIGNTGSGKAQPISTKIPTANGYLEMGEIEPGHEVFTVTGEKTKVLSVHPQGVKDIYRIKFSDGRTAECCEDHLWEVECIKPTDEGTQTMIVDLKTLYKDFKYKDYGHSPKYKIRTLEGPVQYNPRPVPINPYYLGIFIASGIFVREELILTTKDKTLVKAFANANAYDIDYNLSGNDMWRFRDQETGELVKTADFFKDIPELIGIIDCEKFIPIEYLYNDVNIRKELVRGLLDAEANVHFSSKSHNSHNIDVYYDTDSERFVEDFSNLIRGLGYNVEINYTIKGKRAVVFPEITRITLKVPNREIGGLFKNNHMLASTLHNLGDNLRDNSEEFKYIKIVDIELARQEEAKCIYVEHQSHLYITEDFIVTHNTTLAAQIAANIIRQYKYANVIHYDCEQRFDVSRCESITKLPAKYFSSENGGERYMIKTGMVGLDTIQEMIVKTYANKVALKDHLYVTSGYKDEFGKDVYIYEPTVIIIDSITSVINETFNPNSAKDVSDAEKMRGNTEGARDAKSLKGFFKDVLPLCKEANIIIYGINHINTNMSMNAFVPVAKQQNFLKQDESIPGGRTMLYYPFNIIKLTAKPSDDFTDESDGFAGHMVMIEPIKSSSNQSGNNSKGVSFEMVFSFKNGFDPLRTMIMYGRDHGFIEGNKNRMKFKDDDSFTFSLKNIMTEKNEKPIWENIKRFIVPTLVEHLSFIDPTENQFDDRSLDY